MENPLIEFDFSDNIKKCSGCGNFTSKRFIIELVKNIEPTATQFNYCNNCYEEYMNRYRTVCHICNETNGNQVFCIQSDLPFEPFKSWEMDTFICNSEKCKTLALNIHHQIANSCCKVGGQNPNNVMNYFCSVCQARVKPNQRKTCPVCKKGLYCSSECFAKIWPEHKKNFH